MLNKFLINTARYFIQNIRLTIIFFALLVGAGAFSLSQLKTTGFPSPKIDIITVQTSYIGASSQTVNDKITIPLEQKIRELSFVENINSTSVNNFSNLVITPKDGVDITRAISELETKIKSATLPKEAETPIASIPNFGALDVVLSIVEPDKAKMYNYLESLKTQVEKNSATKSFEISNPIEKQIALKIQNLDDTKITKEQILEKVTKIGENIPSGNKIILDGNNTNLSAASDIKTLENLLNQEIVEASTVSPQAFSKKPEEPKKYKVSQFLSFETIYKQDTNSQGLVDGKIQAVQFISITTQKNTDQKVFNQDLDKITAQLEKQTEIKTIKQYSSDLDNQKQVNNILQTLIGSELSIDNEYLKKAGFLFGGLELLFIVLAILVSWRSALIGCLSIPLSLIFTTIYLYFTGESLNTLVLFSFVLVVGLVTDPVLVILESIQRKFDKGDTGLHVIDDAIGEVGSGLFLAFLTNTIIFAPFLLVSGIFGQIIKYIPTTIVPAAFGSLIVPLVFVPVVAYNFLKPKKGASNNEQDNLWLIAKQLIRLNRFLTKRLWVGVLLVILLFSASIFTAIHFNSTGKIKNVQFAEPSVTEQLSFEIEYKATTPVLERENIEKQALEIIAKNPKIAKIFDFAVRGSDNKIVEFKVPEANAKLIIEEINKQLKAQIGDKVFGFNLSQLANGPSESAYQISLALKEENRDKLKIATQKVSQTLSKVCKVEAEFQIVENCESAAQVVAKFDDNYSNSDQNFEILLNADFLQKENFGDNIGFANAQIAQLFKYNNDKELILLDEIPVVLPTNNSPKTKIELENSIIKNFQGDKFKLSDIAKIEPIQIQSSIRRTNGEALNTLEIALKSEFSDQASSSKIQKTILDYYQKDTKAKLGIDKLEPFSSGGVAGITKSFTELLIALVLAIVLSYVVLALFFNSFLQPVNILLSFSFSFLGIYPALYFFSNGQFGFLEIIGMVILIGILENVAIFLIDDARERIKNGTDYREAISLASGFRFRPVLLTSLTNLVSGIPVVILSVDYRNLTLVILSGLVISGMLSLVTTPVMFVLFTNISNTILSTIPRFIKNKILAKILRKK